MTIRRVSARRCGHFVTVLRDDVVRSGMLGWLAGLVDDDGLPRREPLGRVVAPLPVAVENLALNLVWLVVLVNLAGTAFGFLYYGWQLWRTPPLVWPFVPDSPMATLFTAGALASWKLGRPQHWLAALAFVANIKVGLWTPYVHLTFYGHFDYLPTWMIHFLVWSHLAMVVQTFVLHRISDFPPWAIGVAVTWYTVDVVVDYFVPVLGDLHHSWLPTDRTEAVFVGLEALDVAAAGAVTFTLLGVYLLALTRIEKVYSDPRRR